MLEKQLIVIGAGGHSKVLIEALQCVSAHIIGCLDNDTTKERVNVLNVPVLGSDLDLEKYSPQNFHLINGLGSTRDVSSRKAVFEKFKSRGYFFSCVIHPSAVVARDVLFNEGVQVMAGVILQPSVKIGSNSIVNTASSVDHDCEIGAHVHIAPGVTLSGGVVVGDEVHVGTGAKIIHGVRIGSGAMIAAGAVVISDVLDGAIVMGVPAKEVYQ